MLKVYLLLFLSVLSFPYMEARSLSDTTTFSNVINILSQGSNKVMIPAMGMTCLGCAAQIKDALKGIDGVSNIQVDMVKRQVFVDYDSQKVGPDIFVSKIKELGYKPGRPQEVK